ncbi:L-glutamine ABC transporter membrane protein /L-glutamate ABC transporter membrane protein /L-aspartate ABC transporter membrane protein /L-asparagine ABC transporter membrane protein [Sulfitobacter brevis]|uniref:L-glutamine ABC transporter membrane protein /L-glutamate ABC transporter membrane protein /L-aspartate ABC transporter membrane protein /L-asparagine ABC transporter membrane protein n=1 Tax=Sulfitobacter brevis TaxID=74348 RepID=A0A1I1TLS0_9RHOB|nr:ABC transporter permease subunit [Sulfitobacter brevis]SFD59592.1 L-glutamine ABC transporter membrane protein /L-glutamate ABC transporter membrane protein /L-aspartate ABC transporter membrane protein /L-asparagine ABC transporter membrane protein [Sulfitobacter brevis]
MTTLTDPDKESFRLSMLLYDTRYRSITMQVIALGLLVAAFWFLGSNLAANLRAAGLNISYSFLGAPAGYDINQTLIPYTSRSSNLQAAWVGIINTLLVAFLACITATIFGVIAGVLRLSNNWLVRKLMAVYVEIFRNIPVLIWILIIYTIMTVSTPAPNAFRGETPTSTMFLDAFAFTNRGVYIPAPVWGPGSMVVVATFVLSIIGVFAYRRYATKLLFDTGRLLPTFWPSVAIFFLPSILVFFVMGSPIGLEYPALKGFNFQGGIQIGAPLIALWFALSIYTGAFIAENVRAGIQAVSRGQSEAAAALGLRPGRIMNLVVLPQALRVIIPPLISQYLNITKNSSLAILVGYADITATLGGITLNQTGRAIECVTLLMIFYLIISLTISFGMNIYNNSTKLKER